MKLGKLFQLFYVLLLCQFILVNPASAKDGNDKIDLSLIPKKFGVGKSFSIKLPYNASEKREIQLAVYKGNNWLSGVTKTVEKGKSTLSIKFKFKQELEAGNDYEIRGHIRAVGKTWKDALDKGSVKNLVVSGDNISLAKISKVIGSNKLYTFKVDYAASTDRDLILQFSKGKKWLGGKKLKVSKGSGTKELKLKLKEKPVEGKDYKIIAHIAPVGGSWKNAIVSQTLKNITVSNKVPANNKSGVKKNTIDLSKAPTKLKRAKLYIVPVAYTSTKPQVLRLELYKGQTLVAEKKVKVKAGSATVPVSFALKKAPSKGKDYFWKSSLRAEGASWKENTAFAWIQNVVVTK